MCWYGMVPVQRSLLTLKCTVSVKYPFAIIKFRFSSLLNVVFPFCPMLTFYLLFRSNNCLCFLLLFRLRRPVDNALRDAKLSFKDIDEVILVGGSTRIPAVQELVKKMTGKDPNVTVNPDEVVALGAAVQVNHFDICAHYFNIPPSSCRVERSLTLDHLFVMGNLISTHNFDVITNEHRFIEQLIAITSGNAYLEHWNW